MPHGTAITTKYRALNAEHSFLGFPRSDQRAMTGGSHYQRYQHGTIVSSNRGTFPMSGTIDAHWRASDWNRGYLGIPIGNVRSHSLGTYQQFTGGIVYVSKASGRTAGIPNGSIRTEFNRLNAEWGPLGFPRSGVYAPISGRGERQQNFDHGSIVNTPRGAFAVYGPVFDAWAAQRASAGVLGLPTSRLTCGQLNGGCFQSFERGVIQWSEGAGATVRRGAANIDPVAFLTPAQRVCFGGGSLQNPAAECASLTAALPLTPTVGARASDTSNGYDCYTYAATPAMKHCRTGTPGATYRIAVVGNCHMAGLQPMFTELARGRQIEITPFMGPACLLTTTNDPNCRAKYDQQRRALIDQGGFDVVLLHGGSSNQTQTFVTTQINLIAAKNDNVIVIQDNPEIPASANDCITRSTVAQIRRGACDVPEAQATRHYDYYWNSRGATATNVQYVETRDLYCQNGICPVHAGSVLIYRDRIHISITFSWTIAPTIFERIGTALGDPRWSGFAAR